jgi:hypothetical protein
VKLQLITIGVTLNLPLHENVPVTSMLGPGLLAGTVALMVAVPQVKKALPGVKVVGPAVAVNAVAPELVHVVAFAEAAIAPPSPTSPRTTTTMRDSLRMTTP